MTFQNKISIKQIRSIFIILLSFFVIYLIKSNHEDSLALIFIIVLFIIVISFFHLFDESLKRYKISRANDTGEYASNGEKMIAKYFKAKSIKFDLHPKVKVPTKIWRFDNPFNKRTLRPDFFLPQYNVFVEYWGMMDNEDYKRTSELKKKAYRENDIEFISLYPNDLKDKHKLDWNFTQKLLSLIREREGNELEWKK